MIICFKTIGSGFFNIQDTAKEIDMLADIADTMYLRKYKIINVITILMNSSQYSLFMAITIDTCQMLNWDNDYGGPDVECPIDDDEDGPDDADDHIIWNPLFLPW